MSTNLVNSLFEGLDKKFWSKGRLETFKDWPFKPEDGTCTAERMAAAGFYVIENQDDETNISVQCFLCSKQLDGWEPNDDPWREHIKHQNGNCPFVELNKQDEMDWTIEELFSLLKAFYITQATIVVNDAKKRLETDFTKMRKQIPKIINAASKSKK